MTDHLTVLRERERYLADRAELKRKMGWEWQYDERERAALEWAILTLLEGFGQRGVPYMTETKRANAIEALAILFAYHIRQGGYDPDHSAPEDMAEDMAEAVVDNALVQLAASEFG